MNINSKDLNFYVMSQNYQNKLIVIYVVEYEYMSYQKCEKMMVKYFKNDLREQI